MGAGLGLVDLDTTIVATGFGEVGQLALSLGATADEPFFFVQLAPPSAEDKMEMLAHGPPFHAALP